MNKRAIFGAISLAMVSAVPAITLTSPAYSQCAGCGAGYNREDRARVDAYQAGNKQGYEQGHGDGVNQEKMKNGLGNLGTVINNAGEMGAAGVKGR